MAGEARGWTAERVAWLRERAGQCGFALAGVAAAEGETRAEQLHAEYFSEWIEAGRAGEMHYLERRNADGHLLRSAVGVALPWARSVVLCALRYDAGGPLSIEPSEAGTGWIGRYAWSGSAAASAIEPMVLPRDAMKPDATAGIADRANAEAPRPAGDLRPMDYHKVLLERLRRLEAEIQSSMPCESRCYVDTGPIVERSVAARAGVGWIGKNTTVIHQEVGSWTLLASIITSIPVEASGFALEAADRCGSCTRCIDACPTDALIAPRQMDARRCISYLTIEKKGILAEELREGMGRQIFGCDICQEVCPWNARSRREVRTADAEMLPRMKLVNPDLEWLAGMSSAEFRRWFKGSPLERTGRRRLLRNVAIAMGNSRQERFRERLEQWVAGEDEILAEAAQWALERMRA